MKLDKYFKRKPYEVKSQCLPSLIATKGHQKAPFAIKFIHDFVPLFGLLSLNHDHVKSHSHISCLSFSIAPSNTIERHCFGKPTHL